MSSDECYILPSHPLLACLDPLGVCDVDEPTIWAVIVASIQSFRTKVSACNLLDLPRLIEDISYSIHMNGNLDTRNLSHFIKLKYSDPSSPAAMTLLNSILDAALLLADLFPTHAIPYLNSPHPILQLSQLEIKCLLAHQILNTLSPPKGNTWGCTFVCWYSHPQAVDAAVSGYLSALFDYFALPSDTGVQITYRFCTNPADPLENELAQWINTASDPVSSDPVFDHIVLEPTSTATVTFPHVRIPCTLIASNELPGFGASCTQEELVTGACPPLSLLGALLISPPVPSDACLLAYGHAPITQWKGQGREARSLGTFTVSDCTFLFLDASELDLSSPSIGLPDLHPKYLVRDVHKAYTGFLALADLGVKEIASPLWGAGAFGGDPIVKTLILAMAASRANVIVHLSIDENRSYRPTEESNKPATVLSILQRLETSSALTAGALMRRLTSQEAIECRDGWEVAQYLDEMSAVG